MSERVKSSAGKNLSRIIAEGYLDLHTKASQGAFCVWIAINVPAEIFAGFENVVYAVPESHAAMCAGKGIGVEMCEKAEQIGYSMDLCSYARIDIGNATDEGKDSPTNGLPKPDLLVSNTNNCALLSKWFDVHHREWDVPHFIMDIPFCYEPQQSNDRRYIAAQIKDLIQLIEKLSGQQFNPDRVAKAVHHTWNALTHWKRFLGFARQSPSPVTAFDSFAHMAPFLSQRGTPALEEHCKVVANEAEEAIRAGQFPVPKEKYRLFWDNIAPWHQLRNMSIRLAELDAIIVGASYTLCIGSVEGSYELYDWDKKDPFEYLARTMNAYICPYGMKLRQNSVKMAIRDLKVDGVIFASNRSCKPYSIIQMDQQEDISNTYGTPAVMIEMDHADVRKYSEGNAFVRIEALLEMIEAQRSAGT